MIGVRMVAALVAGLLAHPVSAQQQYLNLDFERAGYRVPNEPWGWRRIPWGAVEGSVRLDTVVKHRGRQSLRLERSGGRPMGFDLRLPSAEAALRGKQLTLSAWVRPALSDGDFRLSLSASSSVADSALVRPADPSGWSHLELRVTAPADSSQDIFVRFDLRGAGTIWLDHFELRVDGALVDSIRRGEPAPAALQDVLSRSAVRLQEARNEVDANTLAPMLPMLAGARVIGLGEMTHGTAQFQTTKREAIELAVRGLGVTVVALEESQLTAEALNHWINGGEGDLSALMASIYNMWRTEEMVGLFDWMRRYNATASSRIELIGVDISNVNPELDSLLAVLPVVSPAYAQDARRHLAPIKAIWEQRLFDARPADSLAALRRSAEAVLDHLESEMSTGRASPDAGRVERLTRYARAVVNAVTHLATSGNDLAGRDSVMAANLHRALERRGPGARAVVSAHNTHIARMPGRMGAHLARVFGKAYVPVALTTFQGAYSALIPGATPAAGALRMAPVPLDPAFPGSIEEMMHRVGASRAVVDVRALAATSPSATLLGRATLREIGILAVDVPPRRPFGDFWDIIIHVDVTTATRFLPCPAGLRCWFPG